MIRLAFFLLAPVLVLPALTIAEDHLPTPDYHRQPSDPAWLAQVVQFHGHLGPSVVAGARMGMIGLHAVGAKGYFDVEVTCEGPLARPPQACFLDGIQAATGATIGKRTLNWVQADRLLVRVRNTLTGKTVELQPTPALLGLLASFKPEAKAGTGHGPGQQDHERLEEIARKIAAMPEKDVASVTMTKGNDATRIEEPHANQAKGIAAVLVPTGPAVRTTGHPLDIRPAAEASWGGQIQDVEKVLHSAANELWPYFPGRTLKPILVEPTGGPITLFHRGPSGEYLVRLNTGDKHWAQHAYQFAHEFGHILANYDEHERHNKWFEESICETASLFVMRRMSETWKVRPPYPNWRDYSPALAEYADERLRTAQLPPGMTLAQWYRKNELLLRQEPCLRDKNTIVAAALLPLFEKQPESWEAIGWLNDGMSHGTRTFARYLADWHARVPEKLRPCVRRLAREFAIEIKID